MKLYNLLVWIIVIFYTFHVYPATVNGRFTIISTDSLKFTVLLQINTDSGIGELGGSTIVFEFDTSIIRIDSNPEKNIDFVFYNFDGGNYSAATITRPLTNQVWVNIDLPFNNTNNGTGVAIEPDWTDVVSVNFDIIDPNGFAGLSWITNSPFWGIYDDDNSSLWQTGEFTNLFGPVPVELVSFIGRYLENEYVLLEWKTASSLNNYGFDIEKSYPASEKWENIGFVENRGEPNSSMEYSFIDNTFHLFSTIRYRLKMIDNDGSFEYSEVIEVNTLPQSFELSQNYPNPFNPSTTIRFSLPQASQIKLTLYNLLGELVKILAEGYFDKGYHKIVFEAENLPSGIYLYQLKTDNPSTGSGQGFIETKKMILLK